MELQDALTLSDAYRIRGYDRNAKDSDAAAMVALADEVRRLRALLMRRDLDVDKGNE